MKTFFLLCFFILLCSCSSNKKVKVPIKEVSELTKLVTVKEGELKKYSVSDFEKILELEDECVALRFDKFIKKRCLSLLSLSYARLKNYKKEIEVIERFLKIEKNSTQMNKALTLAYYNYANESYYFKEIYKDAYKYLNIFVNLAQKHNVYNSRRNITYLRLARMIFYREYKEADDNKALYYLEKINSSYIEKSTKNVKANFYYMKGSFFEKKGSRSNKIKDFQQALELYKISLENLKDEKVISELKLIIMKLEKVINNRTSILRK